MLINGSISIQDQSMPVQNQIRPLRSCLLSKKVNGNYVLCIKNSMYPNCINYNVKNLEAVHAKFAKEGKITLRFKQPKHQISVKADDTKMLLMFLRQLEDIIKGKDVKIGTRLIPNKVPAKKDVNRFDPAAREFKAVDRFDRRVLNMRQLNSLILENCVLPTLPEQIGDLPISFLSLAGSKLATSSQYDQDIFWDWMSKTTIGNTLKNLNIDSVNLTIVPFEIMFLRNLQSLSLTKNKLTHLPDCIGELDKLHSLSLSDNKLRFMPARLSLKEFLLLDLAQNNFLNYQQDIDILDKFHENCKNVAREWGTPLSYKNLVSLSICSIIRDHVTFSRKNIPRTLWHLFDTVGRCGTCKKIVPYECFTSLIYFRDPQAREYKCSISKTIPWLQLLCFKCVVLL
ncbi:uncharacterized protein LOC126834705 [Adelges cooleyi]|uniref:uncharacterized protein LOC126834705 n=1 Tax=Adelges cooleyi TaxID=133065 RepID=UPI00217F82AE|nr:uncharacterized protein LOC126834705 [Adelges cooleyi]